MGLVLAGSHDRIRNLTTNAAALWLMEAVYRQDDQRKNPYAIALAAMPNPVDIFERASRRAHQIMAGIRPEQLDAATLPHK